MRRNRHHDSGRGGRFLAEMRGAFDVSDAEMQKRRMRRMGGTATLSQVLAATQLFSIENAILSIP